MQISAFIPVNYDSEPYLNLFFLHVLFFHKLLSKLGNVIELLSTTG